MHRPPCRHFDRHASFYQRAPVDDWTSKGLTLTSVSDRRWHQVDETATPPGQRMADPGASR